jgi:hypothetical protein
VIRQLEAGVRDDTYDSAILVFAYELTIHSSALDLGFEPVECLAGVGLGWSAKVRCLGSISTSYSNMYGLIPLRYSQDIEFKRYLCIKANSLAGVEGIRLNFIGHDHL